VRYVLEGSVRKAGNQIRVTAQLIDSANAGHVWAQRYDRALDDIFAVQDELTMSVIGAIEPTLRKAEIERARRKRPDSLDAYDLYFRALPLTTTCTGRRQGAAIARRGDPVGTGLRCRACNDRLLPRAALSARRRARGNSGCGAKTRPLSDRRRG
jgi:hypothetical protein